MSRKIIAFCPKCYYAVEFSESEGLHEKNCSCGGKVNPVSAETFSKELVEICPVCGLAYFYIDKAFPHRIGLLIIVAGIAGYFIVEKYVPGYGITVLIGLGLIDFLLFFLVREKTICYKCLTEFRGFKRNPAHARFELGMAERFHGDKSKRDKP